MKVGDIVERVHCSWFGMEIGHRGTIMSITGNSVRLREFNGGHSLDNLKLIIKPNWREKLGGKNGIN